VGNLLCLASPVPWKPWTPWTEAAEIALLRQQRSQLREQLESRRRRTLDPSSSPSSHSPSPSHSSLSPLPPPPSGPSPRNQALGGGFYPDPNPPSQPPHPSYQQSDTWGQQDMQQYHQQRHYPTQHPQEPYGPSPSRPSFPHTTQTGRGGPPMAALTAMPIPVLNTAVATILRGAKGPLGSSSGPPGTPLRGCRQCWGRGGGISQGGLSPHSMSVMQTVQALVSECLVGPNVELPMDSTAIARRIKKREQCYDNGHPEQRWWQRRAGDAPAARPGRAGGQGRGRCSTVCSGASD